MRASGFCAYAQKNQESGFTLIIEGRFSIYYISHCFYYINLSFVRILKALDHLSGLVSTPLNGDSPQSYPQAVRIGAAAEGLCR
jgi:hypothetical protein